MHVAYIIFLLHTNGKSCVEIKQLQLIDLTLSGLEGKTQGYWYSYFNPVYLRNLHRVRVHTAIGH